MAWAPLSHWLGLTLMGGDTGWGMIAASVCAALLLMLAAVLSALLAVAVLAMPVIVDVVADRDFAFVAKRNGGTFAGSLRNASVALAVFLPLWLLALILLSVPPIYLAVSLLLNAWLNQRLFRYDALALHADANEIPIVIRGARSRILVLGLDPRTAVVDSLRQPDGAHLRGNRLHVFLSRRTRCRARAERVANTNILGTEHG